MASRHEQVVSDLRDESADLLALVSPLTDADWARATPAAGWSVQDQVNHLAWFDEAATLAVTDPAEFGAGAAALTGDFPDLLVSRQRGMAPATSLSWFRTARAGFLDVAAGSDGALRLPWYGTTMSLTSSVTARLMETWAHGQDVADTLGAHREPTGRLRHVAHLGVATFGFAFAAHGRPVPEQPVRVALTAPDGGTWAWGPDGVPDVVRGPALDFCLVVTQRRHLADTALVVAGPVASAWMEIAQAFAGPPGPGRAPGAR
jgi:uncharacterized protein (TIGR03084 family)